jgi:hypothetical protein
MDNAVLTPDLAIRDRPTKWQSYETAWQGTNSADDVDTSGSCLARSVFVSRAVAVACGGLGKLGAVVR